MSDQKLREIERRWKETGSPDDEAAYLLERVRVGDLTQERLELAAYCGHEGARRAVSSSQTWPPASVESWVAQIPGDRDAFNVIGLGVAEAVLARLVATRSAAADAAQQITSAVREYLSCPCAQHKRACSNHAPLGGEWPLDYSPFHSLISLVFSYPEFRFEELAGVIRPAVLLLDKSPGNAWRQISQVALRSLAPEVVIGTDPQLL